MSKNKIFLFQSDLSGNINGHFNLTESFGSEKELKDFYLKRYHRVFNIIEIKPKSKIGNYNYAYDDPDYKNFNEEPKPTEGEQ